MKSSGQNTGVGSLSLLQGLFPTQGSNPGLPHCTRVLYQLSHKGSPRIPEGIPSPGDFPNPGIKPRPPALQEDSLPVEPPGKPKNTGMGSYSFSSKSSRPRNQTGVSCTAGGFIKNSLPAELPGNRHQTIQSQTKKYNNHSTKAWHKVEWQQMFWMNNLSCPFASRNYTFW